MSTTTKISIVMRKFYKLIAAITLAYGFAPTASAQKAEKDYEPYPHMFVGVQGGVQNTFNNSFNNWKTFTPTASLSFGGYFNKIVGVKVFQLLKLLLNVFCTPPCTPTNM